MMRVIFLTLLLLSLVGTVGAQDATEEAAYTPLIEPTACPFDVLDGFRVDCGTLTVPQDRAQPAGEQVRLAYAVFRSTAINPQPDPLVYLDGGPGSFTLESWTPTFADTFAPFAAERDVILFDYRGAGESQPNLFCQDTLDLTLDTLDDDLSDAEATARYFEVFDACRARFAAEGVDFDFYDSAAMAQDAVDLWTTLGYEQVNLFGVSYGTRLALTIARDNPDGVRSLILDGVLPLEVDRSATLFANADRAFEALFAACAADAACNETYPDLRTVTYDLAARLDAEPAMLRVRLRETNQAYDALLDGAGLLNTLFQSMYATWLIPSLPGAIYDANEGDYGRLTDMVGQFIDSSFTFSEGLYITQECNEELPFNSIETVRAAAEQYPDLAALFASDDLVGEQAYIDNCAGWIDTPPAALENEPVRSDIPTLILSGQFDPITPPSWGEMVGANLPNGYVYTFPGVGHGAITSGESCPVEMAVGWLVDPLFPPDDSCLDEMSAVFEVPITGVDLVRFFDDTQGINAVHPDGWEQTAPASFASSRTYINSVSYFFFPDDRRALLNSLGEFYGGTLIKSFDPVQAGGKEWTIYRMQAQQHTEYVIVATAEVQGFVYMMVVTAGSEEEAQVLYDQLMLPGLPLFEIGGSAAPSGGGFSA